MTIGDKIRSMNDHQLAEMLIGCVDANYDRCWNEPYNLMLTENLSLKAFDTHELVEELSTHFFNADGSFPKVDFCSKIGTITITN